MFDAKRLANVLKRIAKVVNKKSTMRVLTGMLVEVKNNQLTIRGTNMDIDVIYTGNVNSEDFAFVVDADKFTRIVSMLDGTIELIPQGYEIVVKNGRNKFKLATMPVEEYPSMHEIEYQEAIKITANQSDIKEIVKKLEFCTDKDGVKKVLSGIKFDDGVAVATDLHKIATLETEIADGISAVIPLNAVKIMADTFDNEFVWYFPKDRDFVIAKDKEFMIIARLLEDSFPQWRAVIKDKEFTRQITKEDWIDALKKLSTVMAGESGLKAVEIKSEGESTTLQAYSDLVHAEGEIVIPEGIDATFSINIDYLLQALSNMDGEFIWIDSEGSDKPVYLLDSDERYKVLIMPLKK